MKPIVTAVLLLLIGLIPAGCKDLPGASGEYATHDHGHNNRS